MKATLEMPTLTADNNIEKNPNRVYMDAYAKFIEIASHDLKSPLRKLGVLTERLVARYEQVQGEDVKQYTERIHACISEMQSLIEGFAEYAGAVPFSMQAESCDLAVIAEKVLREFSVQIKEKQAEVSITGLPVIQGDAKQLKLLLRKIIENGFKFSRNSDPLRIKITGEEASTEEIRSRSLDSAKKYFRITIADNGIGFSEPDSENIFQPLVRLHGKSSFPGSGLGLALVKRIAENHQGIVFAEGGSNGASIILLLPENQDQ